MKLEERKIALLSLLQGKGITADESKEHQSLINCNNLNVYILSNFGNQITFNGSKKSIEAIRNTEIDKIKYNSLRVNFFAIPSYGKGFDGKRTELCDKWCFIPSFQVYNSIKQYIDNDGETWASNPKKDWVGNISLNEFYWKSDAGKHREKIIWDNFADLHIERSSHEQLDEDINNITSDNSLSETDKLTLIKARKGQGKYRDSLIKFWGACAITGCDNKSILRASHIKPWKSSNNKDRLNSFNGLLLTANFDLLFDQGLISFCNQGKIIISNNLDQKTRSILGVDIDISINLLQEHLPFLEFHRAKVFQTK
jgi:hypothetical protein